MAFQRLLPIQMRIMPKPSGQAAMRAPHEPDHGWTVRMKQFETDSFVKAQES